ncbi:hypothetical protein [Streptomyces sp. CB01881]|uniref:DUF7144 family membrane protein n=1 Tax=Streptomyces sp. CB01881 TaxID=2078691 RepID=UPI000CDBC986|nr:hypothetical protein [Streptomyces sp. CB01881]AUY47960.1 hypothetical protein C2142_02120 [Streptomyces sp. CB01881]TYC76438.1 hypothetical protein EH183_02120 [Streptomyces sp. CB01881]
MATAQHHAQPVGPSASSPAAHADAMLTFAAVLMGVLALFNGLDGIAAINRSHVFVGNAHYVFGDLRAWGWAILALAIAQGFTVVGILARVQVARWFGVGVLVLNGFAQMAFIPSYPVWSVMIIALDVIAIYALIAHGGRTEPRTEPERTATGPSGTAGGDAGG